MHSKIAIVLISTALLVPELCGAQQAASIKYRLAESELNVSLDLVLEACSPQLRASPTLTIVPSGSAGFDEYSIGAQQLEGGLKKRTLTVAIYPNGAVKSINAQTESRTAAVIGQIFKFATAAAGAGMLGLAESTLCSQPTADAIAELDVLKKRIGLIGTEIACNTVASRRNDGDCKSLAADMKAEGMTKVEVTNDFPVYLKSRREVLEGLTARVGELRAGPLRLTLNTIVDLHAGQHKATDFIGNPCQLIGGTVDAAQCIVPVTWSSSSFAKWLKNTAGEQVAEQVAELFELQLNFGKPPVLALPESACGRRACPYLVTREAPSLEVLVSARNPDVLRPLNGEPFPPLMLALGQWGQLAELPLRAGFGRSRTAMLEFDPYGRKTLFSWSSNAVAEGVTSGLADTTGSLNSYLSGTAEATQLQQNQQRVTELETQLKLNKLLQCEAVISSGGYVCPE